MKARRLLALVLCFVMLFSDATSTLASTNSGEPIVITDSSELEELLNVEVIETEVADTEVLPAEEPETDVISTEETSEEAASTETTEVAVPEGTEVLEEEPESATETADTTEVVESTEAVEEETKEDVIIEEAEDIKAATTSIMVGYSDGDNWVNIGTTPYTSIADAVAAIQAHIADNPGFNKNVSMNLQADAELTGDLDLDTVDVKLSIGLNGHNLIVLNDAVIRADVHSPKENLGTVEVAAGVNLTILPFDPCGEGMSDDEDWEIEQGQTDVEFTNWQYVNINFDSSNPGNLVIGQSEYEGGSTKAHIRLNDVYINNAKNVTIEGNVGIGGNDVDPSTIQFNVAETITVNNKGDNHYENHYVQLLVSTNCNNMVWYTDGTIGDLIVNDTMTTDTESNLTIYGQFTVNNIHVEALDDPWGCFGVVTRHIYKADGTLESAATITINGQLTCGEGLDNPLSFHKEKWAYESPSAEEPKHIGMLAYEEGEVVATAPNVNRQLVSLNNEGSDRWLFAAKNEQGQLVVQKAAVEVMHWNDETNDFDIQIYYSSLEEAVSGMYTEFGEAAGQYIIRLYDDIRLNEDLTLPDYATYVRVEANRRAIDVFHENGEYDYSFDETTFVNVDFNGHTISVNGNVEWSEAISMTNSAETKAELYLRSNEESGFMLQSLWTDSEREQVYINAAGEPVTWPIAEYALITGVNIHIPNGFVDVGVHESDTTTRVIDAEVIANGIRIHNGTWKITDLTVFGREAGSHFNAEADLTVTGTFTATGGSFIEVRGKLQLGDIVLKPHQEDPYANLHFQIVKTFGPENPEVLTASGQIIFTGGLVVEEGFEGIPLSLDKKHVIRTYMLDENGEIMYEDEAKRNPCIHEEDRWDNIVYEAGEVLATITESSNLTASMFMINGGSALAIVGDGSLKVGKAAVKVHLYIPEEDRGFECGYESLEDAMAKMQEDFGGRVGEYTITLLEDTTLTQNIVLPDFVQRVRFETACEWVEHLDENGEPIRIYDDAGHEIGIEGHNKITALKLDMNGHSITANCDMEWSEMLKIINDSDQASEIYIKAEANPGPEGYWPSFRTAWLDENAELVYSDNSPFDFGAEHTWIDNVTLRVPNGRVEFETWDDGIHIINGELIVSSFKAHNGSWIVADVTIVGATDGSFIGENAKAVIAGKTTWLGGAGVEVRGELTFNEFFMNANAEDPYANMWVEIAEVFDKDKEGTDEYFISKGELTFAGAIEISEAFKAGKAVHIGKKQVYYYQARDEHGNLLFHDEAKTDPMIWEDQWGGLGFESDETAAYVTDSRVNANQFSTNGSGISFEIVGQELKAYKADIYVDLYIEEEDRGIGFNYKTLEDAFANLERDFEGRAGSYTFNILKDVELAEDIVLPDFVKNLRLQTEWIWYEHYDENGNVIEIYDEEGNFVGIEGHHDAYVATLDLNGHSITTAGHIEVMEGLQVISDATNKGALISTSENGGVSISQIENRGALIVGTGATIEVSQDNPFVMIDNVDVTAEKAHVNLWSQWGAHTVNGDITARFMNVRGVWNVGDVKITNDLCIESGWYDEASDYGEPDGYLTAENVSLYNAYMYNGGRLVVKDTFTAKNTNIENYAVLIADKLIVPSGEFHNFEQVSVKDAQIEWFYNHTDIMFFEDDPATPEENEEHMEEWGSLFIADTFTQSGDGSSYMEGSSTLIVNKKAVLNNLCVGAWNPDAQGAPAIIRMPGAELEINEDIYPGEREMPLDIGIINKPNDSVVGLRIVEVFDKDPQTGTIYGSWFETAFVNANGEKAAEIGEYGWPLKTYAKDEVLFTTDIKNVRLDLIALFQHVEEGKEDEVIWEISQDGNKVVVGGYTIFVHSVSNGDWKWLKDFKDWSEAVAYIDSLANPNLVYVIEVTENINIDGTLPLPKNAAEVVIHGLSDEQIGLSFKGDLSLNSNLVLDNINMNVPNTTMKLNGFVWVVDEASTVSVGSVVGAKESIVAVCRNSVFMVRKAVTGLAGLEAMYGAVVELGIDNTVDASTMDTLQMYSGRVAIYDKLTVKDVVSWNDLNEIAISGGDCFTITGNVYGPEAWDEHLGQFAGEIEVGEDNTFAISENNPAKAKIRAAAIDIQSNRNLVEGDVLVTAPNVSASWFVTGSRLEYLKDQETGEKIQDENGEYIIIKTGIGSLTHKDGDTICYGEGDTTEKVVELKIFDNAVSDFITYESYKTLNDAFTAIETLNNSEGRYRIMLNADVEIDSLVTPSKAMIVQIWSEGHAKTIKYDNADIKLNTNFLIGNSILQPKTGTSAISMDKYGLSLVEGTKMAENCKMTSVTGSGIGKGSIFELYNVSLEVLGDVKDVDVVYISGSELIVNGAVNVGDIHAGGAENQKYQPTLVGSAVVTRNEDNKITKLDPQITITGEVAWQDEQLTIALREKGTENYINFLEADESLWTNGILLAKAPKAASMMVCLSDKNIKDANYVSAKANGYLVCQNVNNIGLSVEYRETYYEDVYNEETGEWRTEEREAYISSNCKTFADAVKEIDALKTKREYYIYLLPKMSAISAKEPAALKMPNAKYVDTLYIMTGGNGYAGSPYTADLHYTGNITFTSNAVVENVDFVQVAKNAAGQYVSVNELKGGYPEAVTISTGGDSLSVANVSFNTPIKLDGKKSGNLGINGPVVTYTNEDSTRANGSILGDVNGDNIADLSRVCGSITNFNEVAILSDFILDEYKSGSKYVAPTVSATTLAVVNSIFDVNSYDTKAKATIKELFTSNGELYVEGTASITDAELTGSAWVEAIDKLTVKNVALYDSPIMLGGKFEITGTVNVYTDNAVLASMQKSATDKTPGLNIKGKVELEDDAYQIGVLVYGYDEKGNFSVADLSGAPNASAMLLIAKNVSAGMFKAGTVKTDTGVLDNLVDAKVNQYGYSLVKSGSNIYVYYGDETKVELRKQDESYGYDTLGYYNSIAEATKAIDALKDSDASYMLMLLNEYGSETAPAELKMPKYANTVAVQKNNGKMYISSKVALNASTALVIASEAEFAKDITGKGTLEIAGNTTITVNGKFDAANLVLNGDSTLDAKGVVTIGTIANNGNSQNKIIYGKSAKDVTNLTIKGWVSGYNSNKVLLQMNSDTAKASYALNSENGKVILDNTQKIATIEKAALSSFEVSIKGEKITTQSQLVKANKGVYYLNEANANGTWLTFEKDGNSYTTYCLDLAQAVNEINALADKTTDYTINVGCTNESIKDTNLTDAKTVSAITMPKANVANSVMIAYSGNNGQRGIEFTGNIAYAGNLGFRNCEIEAKNISKVKTLTLDNTAFVTTGTVKADNVVIKGNTTWDAFGKTTVGGLDATEKGNSSYIASKPDAKGVPTFVVNGEVPAMTAWKVIKANATADTAVANRYVDTYKDVSLVVAKAAGADRFMAYPFVDADAGNNEGITNLVAYKDTKNAVKNGNSDDMKVLLSYEGGSTYVKSYDEAVKLIDAIGNKNGFYTIQFLTSGEVTTTGVAGSYGKLTLPKKAAYVEICGHTVTNGKADTTLKYTGTMKTSVGLNLRDIELTEGTVKGDVFTPSYAVTPVTSGKNTEINFFGAVSTMKKDNIQTADLAFTSVGGNGVIVIRDRNVDVAGSVAANIFVMNNGGTVSVEKDVKVTEFIIADNAMIETKGKFTAKIVRVLDLVEEDLSAVIDADGAIAITDIYDGDGDATDKGALRIVTNRTANKNESQLTVSGQISNVDVAIAMNKYDAALDAYCAMNMEEVTAMFVSEEGAVPTKEQMLMTAPKASSMFVHAAAYVENEEEQRAGWETVYKVYDQYMDAESEVSTYVHDGGMYLTDLMPLMVVAGGTEENGPFYTSYFMDWTQAVNQIDKKLNNKNALYEMVVLRSVGRKLDGTLEPIKNPALPTKADRVYVISGMGDNAGVFFTGTKLTAKANTEIWATNFVAVKEMEEDGDTWYESAAFDMNIGNYELVMNNVHGWADGYESKVGTISGSKKGHLVFSRYRDAEVNETVASMIKGIGTVEFAEFNDNDENDPWQASYYVPKGITGVQNLILQPYTFVGAFEGDISVKDVYADRADMYAKNITVSGTIEMSYTGLSAGTETIGDGAIKLKDVVLNSKCAIYGSQDKNGKSLIQINGNISTGSEFEGDTDGLLTVGLFYNNDSGWVPLSNKLVLLTAPKADASWFVPNYSREVYEQAVDEETGEPLWDEDGNPIFVQVVDEETGEPLFDEYGNPIYVVRFVQDCMGWEREGYGTYKLGNVIYYGKLAE